MSTQAKTQPNSGERDRLTGSLLLYVALAVAAVFAFFPIYWMLATSLRPNTEVFAFPPTLLPQTFTLEHYQNFIRNPDLLRYLWNSLLIASMTAISSLVVSTYAAYAFSKFRFTGRRSLMFLILSAQMFPASPVADHPLPDVRAVALAQHLPGAGALLHYVHAAALYLDAERLLRPDSQRPDRSSQGGWRQPVADHSPGAGARHRPALVATGLFAFMRGWNDFIYALTLVGKDKQTLPPGLVLTYIGEFQAQWADMMAASLLVSLPLVIAFIIFQRHIVSGLTAGAVKG